MVACVSVSQNCLIHNGETNAENLFDQLFPLSGLRAEVRNIDLRYTHRYGVAANATNHYSEQ